MERETLAAIFNDFDVFNKQDPSQEELEGKSVPKEFAYAVRMSSRLDEYDPNASPAVKLAARCQHIGRWKIPRSSYPMDKVGYIKWRNELKKFHAETAGSIMEKHRVDRDLIDRVKFLVQKKDLKNDPETQTLEDVVCLVFLEHYLEEFAGKHPEDKLIDILAKTWRKMSPRAQKAALKIAYSDRIGRLLEQVLDRK